MDGTERNGMGAAICAHVRMTNEWRDRDWIFLGMALDGFEVIRVLFVDHLVLPGLGIDGLL